jgi:hypothetical protein
MLWENKDNAMTRLRPGVFTLAAVLGRHMLRQRIAQWLAVVVVLAIGTLPAAGQTLYGFGPVLNSNDIFVYTIDPATGAFTRVADAGDPPFNRAALDSVGQRLFYVQDPNLYILDLRSKAITSMLTFNVVETMEYDRGRDTLYEASRVGSLLFIEAIRPGIANGSQVAFLGTPDHVLSAAIDHTRQQLFLLTKAAVTTLYRVDLLTGAFSSVPSGPLADLTNGFLLFDALRGVLYGVGQRVGDSGYSLFTIDQETGAFALIVALGPSVFTVALDPERRRLFFTAPSTLFTLDLGTNVISSAPIERCCPTLFVAPAAVSAVPTLGWAAWIVLALSLAAIGTRFVAGTR